ncbi:MAG: RdgB/HAM1 family non-canonical purine NTP pyrophosphatase [Spongiibacteraceae bacterium]|nr:RdgB/HAM1 family non-canonical purine NTP pyrophosphatase [Spongiibacteraceae bacterium]
MTKIVLASGNRGKLKELQQLLSEHTVEVIPQSTFNVPEAIENGLSFVENALIKARNASKHTGLPALADDSGLEVDALLGQPGIYSARFAGPKANDADNNSKLLHQLQNVPESQRSARFQCLLVYIRHESDPTPLIFQGSWEGQILFENSGNNGFGYDPLFFVPEKNCSSADLPADIKNTICHRGKAMAKLLAHWNSH